MKNALNAHLAVPDSNRLPIGSLNATTRIRLPRRRKAGPASRETGLLPQVRTDFLAALGDGASFESACRRARTSRAAILAERVRCRDFAAQWDRINDARLAEVETLLMERTIAGLAGEADAETLAGDTRDKFHVALGQWLLETRASHRFSKSRSSRPATVPGQATSTPKSASAKPAVSARSDAVDAEAKVRTLIEQVERRMREAEALNGSGPATSD